MIEHYLHVGLTKLYPIYIIVGHCGLLLWRAFTMNLGRWSVVVLQSSGQSLMYWLLQDCDSVV